ncbi:uncharacterized protein [Penaeus vannamei]|uniref:uncharacterized protein n=1 Tax=Penaeus vannamei TaxID=6689 RepID=UPI00387F89C1
MLRSRAVLACSAEHKWEQCSWPDHLLANKTSRDVAIFTYSELHSPANDSYFYDHHRPDDRYVCAADVREVRPAWGRADDGSLLKIVNTKAFPQKIRMEVCRRAGEPCTFLAKAVRSSCRQRYSIHKMAAVDPRDPDGGVFLAAFKVPSGCFCHVRQGSSLFSGTSEDSPEDSPSASPLVQNLTQDLQALDGTFSSQGEKESDQAEDVTFITPGSFQFSGQPSSSLGQNVQNTPFRHLIGEESHLQSQFSTTTDQIQNLPSVTQSQSSSGTVSQNSDVLVSSSQNSADEFVTSFPNSLDNFVSSSQNSAGTFETPFTTLSPPTSSFNPHPVTTIAPNPTFPPNQVISTFEQDFTNISNEVGSPGVSVTSQTDETVASHHIITKLDETVLDSSNSVQQSASEPTLSGDESKLHTVSDTFITTPFDLSPLRQNPTDGNYILSLRRVMDDGTEQPLDVVISVDGRLMGAVNHPAQAPSPITLQNLSNDQSLNLGLLFNELDQQTDVLRDKRHMNHMNDPNSTVSLSTVLQNLTNSQEITTVLKNGGDIKVRPYVTTHYANGTRQNRTSALNAIQMTRNSPAQGPSSENASTPYLSPSSTASPFVQHSSESPVDSLQSLTNLLDNNVHLIPSTTAKAHHSPSPTGPSGINRSRPFSINLTRKRTQYSLIPKVHIQNESSSLENITLYVPEILRMMRTGQMSKNIEERSQLSSNWHPALLSTHLYATHPQVIQNYYIQVPEGNQGLGREAEDEQWSPKMRPLNQRSSELLEEDDSVQIHVNEFEKRSNFTDEELPKYSPPSGSQEMLKALADSKDGLDLHMSLNQTPSLITSSPLLQHLSSFVPSSAKFLVRDILTIKTDFFRIKTSAPEVTISSEEGDLEVNDDAPLTPSRTTRDTTSSTPNYVADQDQILTLNPVKLDKSNYTEDKRDTVYDKNDQVYASSPAAVEHLEPETSKRVLATPSKQKDVNQSKGQDSQIRQCNEKDFFENMTRLKCRNRIRSKMSAATSSLCKCYRLISARQIIVQYL